MSTIQTRTDPLLVESLFGEPVAISRPQHTLDGDRARLRHDSPVRIPASRGRTSEALLRLLDRPPGSPGVGDLSWHGSAAQAVTDDDLQLALWLSYELHYRGLAGVDDDWEGQPTLVALQRTWESQLVAGLEQQVQARYGKAAAAPDDVPTALEKLASTERGPSLDGWLMRSAPSAQFAEFLIHRSIYDLKEADPHTWAIPRLSGAVKAAMITIQLDEYGLGITTAMHAQLFRVLLQDWGLDDRYGAQLDRVPGVTLLGTNIISLFGRRRRWRGALVGHLSLFKMTSSAPNARYARGHRRLGGGEGAAAFFDTSWPTPCTSRSPSTSWRVGSRGPSPTSPPTSSSALDAPLSLTTSSVRISCRRGMPVDRAGAARARQPREREGRGRGVDHGLPGRSAARPGSGVDPRRGWTTGRARPQRHRVVPVRSVWAQAVVRRLPPVVALP